MPRVGHLHLVDGLSGMTSTQTRKIVFPIVLSLILINQTVSAQTKPVIGSTCEDALALLDTAALDAMKDPDSYIIVIARLGDRERSTALNQRRLKAVLERLNDKARNKVAGASGARVSGSGRVEIYVGGKLLYVLSYSRNGIIDCRGCCG